MFWFIANHLVQLAAIIFLLAMIGAVRFAGKNNAL